MPASRPRASFDPISPTFDLSALVEETPNMVYVDRISCEMIDAQGQDAFDKLILLHTIIGGKPLVIDGYQSRLDPWTFSSKWLQDNVGDKQEEGQNLARGEKMPLSIGHYLRNMSKLTDQFFERADNYKEKGRQRVYLKDIDCPEVWFDKIKEQLPANTLYLNDNTAEVGGPGAIDETIPTGGKRKGKGIGPAGDLMSSLPPAMRAENLMCYIGHEGTYTPAHREMCGTIGHNIMVEASNVLGEDGKPEKPGSSIWFMTESGDRHSVAEYWLSILGHDIEVEKHFAQVAAWKRAPFKTYVCEQRPGDFIIIPPLAPHQVWNRGTRTMKVAWNRTTIDTLELAMKEALPNAKMVCRDEQYKNKAIIYYTLEKYSNHLSRAKDQEHTASSPQAAAALRTSPKIRQVQRDFKRLFQLFKDIMLSEMFAPDSNERHPQFFQFDSNITCAYCRGNIFNRFLTCPSCDTALGTDVPEPYDICMECYAMGRSCGCISKLKWAEQFKWKELVGKYEKWRLQYLEIQKKETPDRPLLLAEERQRLEKKTLAQICQEQLKLRPFVDINKKADQNDDPGAESEEIEVNDDGTVKKKKKKSKAWMEKTHACHICQHRHEKWKMAMCGCGRWWCYGSLFRAHDLMPQDVMANPDWQCPHCQGICGAGSCRKDTRQKPYQPKGTLLGHDTRKVADARSVESLVDFSVSNISWLGENSREAPVDNARLVERQQEADAAKLAMSMVGEDPNNSDAEDNRIEYSPEAETTFIDPRLQLDDSIIDPSLTQGDHPGYQPATHNGYVAPSALMYNPALNGSDSYAGFDEDTTGQAGKRRRDAAGDDDSLLRASTKRARLDDVDASGATKQYRKEQERKALEEARKQGRFIQVHARLKGKSKLIKLPISRDVLTRLQGTESDTMDLLRSDLAPPPEKVSASTAKPKQNGKQVRVRVEPDEDFGTTRPRRDRPNAGNDASKKGVVEYEDLDIDSDPEANGADETERPTTGRSRRRRISAWQARRRDDEGDEDGEGEEEYPEELPEDWKDRSRKRNRPSRAGKAASAITDVAEGVNGTHDVPQDQSNRLAKLAAAGLRKSLPDVSAQGPEEDDYEDVDNEDDEGQAPGLMPAKGSVKGVAMSGYVKPVASMAGSILSRTGPGGRPIKIVSAKKRKKQDRRNNSQQLGIGNET